MKKFKKILAVLMAMVMLVCMMPMVVANAGGDEVKITLDTPYEMWVGPDGETLKFSPESDGWYQFSSQGNYDTVASLYNSDWEEIAYSDDGFDEDYNFRIVEKLYEGYTYYLDVDVIDIEESETAVFPVVVTEALGVEGIEITKSPDNPTCIEGFEYSTVDLTGLEAEFTLSDGSTVDWAFDTDEKNINGIFIEINVDEDGYGHFFYEIICGEGYAIEFLEVIENPVESIELKDKIVVEYYENSGGYFDDYFGYYIYYTNIPYDAVFVINYKDGTSEEMIAWDIPFINFSDTQEEEAWKAGGEYELTVSLLGAQTTIPVCVYECPFVNVTVNSAPTRQYIFGDENYGDLYVDDVTEYRLYPFDFSGLSFTAEYKDGTKQTFDEDDFDLGYLEIDGSSVDFDSIFCTEIGTYEATMVFRGYTIKYPVEVIDKPAYTLGDVNLNGEITILDATAIQMHLAKKNTLEGVALLAADTNCDTKISIVDATNIQLLLAKKITQF